MNLLNIDDGVVNAPIGRGSRHAGAILFAVTELHDLAQRLHDRLTVTQPHRRSSYRAAMIALGSAHPLRLESMQAAIREIESALAGELPER